MSLDLVYFYGEDDNWYAFVRYYPDSQRIWDTYLALNDGTLMDDTLLHTVVGSIEGTPSKHIHKLYRLNITNGTATEVTVTNEIIKKYRYDDTSSDYYTYYLKSVMPIKSKTMPLVLKYYDHSYEGKFYIRLYGGDGGYMVTVYDNTDIVYSTTKSKYIPNVIYYGIGDTGKFVNGYDIYTAPFTNMTGKQWQSAPNQFTLTDASQLEDDVIGYGPNGVITGDGTIWDKIPDSFRMEDVLNLSIVYNSDGSKLYGTNSSLVTNFEDNKKVHYLKKISSGTPDYIVGKIKSYTKTPIVIPDFGSIQVNNYVLSEDGRYGIANGYDYSTWTGHLIRKDFDNDTILFDEEGYNWVFNMNNCMYIMKNNILYKWAPEDAAMTQIATSVPNSYTMIDNKVWCAVDGYNFMLYDGTNMVNVLNTGNELYYYVFKHGNTLYILYRGNNSTLYSLMSVDLTTLQSTVIYTDETFDIPDNIMSQYVSIHDCMIKDNVAYTFQGEYDWSTSTTSYNGIKIALDGTELSTYDLYLNDEQVSAQNSANYYGNGVFAMNYNIQDGDNNKYYYLMFNDIVYNSTLNGYSIDVYALQSSNANGTIINNGEISSVQIDMYNGDGRVQTFDGLNLVEFSYTWRNTYEAVEISYTISNIGNYVESTYNDYDIAVINGYASDNSSYYSQNHVIQISEVLPLTAEEYNTVLQTSQDILGEE